VGFLKPTGFQLVHVLDFKSINMAPERMGLEPRSHVNQFQIDLNMATNSIGAFLFKHQKEKKLKTTP
jgi:hypothetical protein